MDNHRLADDDPSFIDAILHEVKSQGLFDQFRKDCQSDVDTKPAYQNLRQRVENSVANFLNQQTWTPDLSRNQLREKLRKNIIEAGFLDTGVERIVDQVVNPKISTVYHPQVEEIVYKYLGIEKPRETENGEVEIKTDLLPTDLEAVSPDSDKKSQSTSFGPRGTFVADGNDELNESKENAEEFESPPFEPLEARPPSGLKHDSNDSGSSKISGLTSQESVESEPEQKVKVDEEEIKEELPENNMSIEAAQNDSQLSQVSSNSRLSTNTVSEGVTTPRLDITEEAQMPKFNENSNSEMFEKETKMEEDDGEQPQKSNFDLKKEEYEFKGTERKTVPLNEESPVKEEVEEKEEVKEEVSEVKEESTQSERSLKICEETATETKVLDSSIEDSPPRNKKEESSYGFTEAKEKKEESSDGSKDKKDDKSKEKEREKHRDHDREKHRKSDRKDRDKERERDKKKSSHSSSSRHHSSSSKDKSVSKSSRRDDSKDSKDRDRHRSSDHKHKRSSSSHHHSSADRHHHDSSKKSHSSRSKSDHKSDEQKKKENETKKIEDDHYNEHEKPIKKRRSTDRDSNDGANSQNNNGNKEPASITSSQSSAVSSTSSISQTPPRDGKEKADDLNDTKESLFEGFEESPVKKSPKGPPLSSLHKNKTSGKKTMKKPVAKTPIPKDKAVKEPQNIEVFSFSFDKPLKLGKNGEIIPEPEPEIPDPAPVPEVATASIPEVATAPVPKVAAALVPEVAAVPVPEVAAVAVPEVAPEIVLEPEQNEQEHDFPPQIILDPNDMMKYPTPPVRVDQMLTNGNSDIDLELLIGQNHIEGEARERIEETLKTVRNKIKKPRFAANFAEARKLDKIRKQMERQEQKKLERARVIMQQYMDKNKSEVDNQGIELEFCCDRNAKTSAAPIISSPVRKAIANKTGEEEEKDLVSFPVDDEVYPENEDYVKYLKEKVENPKDCIVDKKIKLFRIGDMIAEDEKTKNKGKKIILQHEIQEDVKEKTMDELFRENNKVNLVEKKIEKSLDRYSEAEFKIPKRNDASSKDKGGRNSATSNKRKYDIRECSVEVETLIDFEDIIDSSEISSEKLNDLSEKEKTKIPEPTANPKVPVTNGIIPRPATKRRRVGLAKPKAKTLNNNVASPVVEEKSEPLKKAPTTPHYNNNSISNQRYSSDDLYKPRPMNGLRSTRRSRVVEQ